MSSHSLSLSRSPSPYVAPEVPDKDFLEDFSPENPEDAVPLGWDDSYLDQEAYSFGWGDDEGTRDEPATAETDGLCPTTSPGFGREIGNMPPHVSPLRAGGIEGRDDSSLSADTLPHYAGGEVLTTVSSLTGVGDDSDSDFGDSDSSDFSHFGCDLEDLVVYCPSRPVDDDDEEDDTSEVDAEDECEDEDEDEDADGDEDDVVEGGEVIRRPVSPDLTPDCAAEEEESVVEEDEDINESSNSPCHCTTGNNRCTPDSERPAQGPEDDVNGAALVAQSQTQRPQPWVYTFPPLADLTKEEMVPWKRNKRTAFLHPFMLDPDDVVECGVPGSDGLPCGERFSHREIADAREHYRKVHFPTEQQQPKTAVVCPWPDCEKPNLKYEATGRHLDDHWGMRYQCPFCPQKPIPRSDSAFRHMLGKRCKKLQAACRNPRLPSMSARSEATEQPEAGPSTQRKRPARAPTRQTKPQPRARAQPKQPVSGPSRGQKRSRRFVEEEEDEMSEEDVEVDDDNDDDSDWVPTKSDRKGKGKAPARKRKRR